MERTVRNERLIGTVGVIYRNCWNLLVELVELVDWLIWLIG